MAQITWLGHDSFRISNDKVIYIDPYQIKGGPPADLILVTHDHYDHLSVDDIKKLRKEDTVVVTTPAAARKLAGPVRTVKPGDKLSVRGIDVEVVPAYNTNKKFHPKEAGGVGFIVIVDGERIYHAGDTDVIPEMKGLKVDTALLPVSGTYVMTAEEAAKAAEMIQPKQAIPMHYGTIVGSEADAQRFQKLSPVPVRILKPER